MKMLFGTPHAIDLMLGWEPNLSMWPVCDIDGTLLLFTETERRQTTSGKYEYRVRLDSDA